MVESLMLIALGFLTATLFALIAVQLVWRRAVKVTTRRLEGDISAEEARQAVERLAAIEIVLQDKQHEIDALTQRNTTVEETLAQASYDAQTLRDEIAALRESHDAARADAEHHAQNVAALQSRIADLEAAASAEIARQGDIASQLKNLGEKAARLVSEMSSVFGTAGNMQALEAAIAHPEPAAPEPVAPAPSAPVQLTPFPTEAADSDDDRRLAEIKASLSNFSEGVGPEEVDEDDKPLPNESFLAERIRALESGVAP
jgi:DNA repair exonuclease SbcCD ATPase subunit